MWKCFKQKYWLEKKTVNTCRNSETLHKEAKAKIQEEEQIQLSYTLLAKVEMSPMDPNHRGFVERHFSIETEETTGKLIKL